MLESLLVSTRVLGAGFTQASSFLFQRWVLKGKSFPAYFLAWSMTFSTAGFVLVYLLAWGITWPPHLEKGFWSAVFIATVLNYGIQYVGAKALTYKHGEVSLVGPLSAMTPGLITLLAVTLGEYPKPLGILGVIAVAVGSWVLLYPRGKNPEHWWGYFGPLYRLGLIIRFSKLSQEERERAIVVWLMFGGALLGTFSQLFVGLYTRRGGDLQGMWVAVTVLWGLLALGFWMQHFLTATAEAKVEWKGDEKKMFIAALAGAGGLVLGTYLGGPMLAVTYIAFVTALTRVRILFEVLFGWLFFDEQDIKKRFLATTITIVGIALIATQHLPERLTDKLEFFGF